MDRRMNQPLSLKDTPRRLRHPRWCLDYHLLSLPHSARYDTTLTMPRRQQRGLIPALPPSAEAEVPCRQGVLPSYLWIR